jgi:hypothetical protein
MTTSDLSTVPAHLRGIAARKRQQRLRDDSVGATASASGSTRPTFSVTDGAGKAGQKQSQLRLSYSHAP